MASEPKDGWAALRELRLDVLRDATSIPAPSPNSLAEVWYRYFLGKIDRLLAAAPPEPQEAAQPVVDIVGLPAAVRDELGARLEAQQATDAERDAAIERAKVERLRETLAERRKWFLTPEGQTFPGMADRRELVESIQQDFDVLFPAPPPANSPPR